MRLPTAFCWSKYGTEAGEPAPKILERKEKERQADEGNFLWGIGTSIRPSLLSLLEEDRCPSVLFTPMLSAPSASDCAPRQVLQWTSAIGIGGRTFNVPPSSLVTSSISSRRRHYALVCRSDESLLVDRDDIWIDPAQLRNLLTGNPIGSSQVTSVVRSISTLTSHKPRYRVSFLAHLQPPYLVVLGDPKILWDNLEQAFPDDLSRKQVHALNHAVPEAIAAAG